MRTPASPAIARSVALVLLLLTAAPAAAEPAPRPQVLEPVVVVDDAKRLHVFWGTLFEPLEIDALAVPGSAAAPDRPDPGILPVQRPSVPAPDDVIRATAFPNPSNGPVTVRAEDAAAVSVQVYDVAGRMLAGLDGSAGEVTWDGRDAQGRPAPGGVYFARVRAEGASAKTLRIVRR
jgi:hypothetical protein